MIHTNRNWTEYEAFYVKQILDKYNIKCEVINVLVSETGCYFDILTDRVGIRCESEEDEVALLLKISDKDRREIIDD